MESLHVLDVLEESIGGNSHDDVLVISNFGFLKLLIHLSGVSLNAIFSFVVLFLSLYQSLVIKLESFLIGG